MRTTSTSTPRRLATALCAATLLVGAPAHALTAETRAVGTGTARVVTVEQPGQTIELRSVVPTGRNRFFMIVGTRADNDGAMSTQLQSVAGTVGTAPELRSQLLRAPGTDSAGLGMSDASPLSGALLAAGPQGLPYAIAVAPSGAVQLTRLGMSGRAEQAFSVALDLRSVVIRRFTSVNNDSFLAAGSAGYRPLVVAIGSSGQVLRRHVLLEDDAAAVAAALLPGGDMAVLVEKGTPNDPGFLLLTLAQDGAVKQRVELAGRPIDLAVGAQRQLVVLVERQAVASRALIAIGFNADVQEQWRRELVVEPGLLGRFRIQRLAGGDYLVAGRKSRGLWLTRLSPAGAERWTSWTDPKTRADLEMTLDVDLALDDNQVLLAYSAMVVSGRQQSAVVRVMQLPLN